ncbi:hypothetical protein [Pseudomonas sp. GOM6]|uniref:hypothetical protein n=1 Tax=Pseudomonas sp. GOM6 TaxID=3036944 RepID=UPI002409924E|nr:hypothetical protein [Pseudomonas sp. GOM6]MDG1581044.1 hypothetical protein [Pseudomonas sp. GOM6]
MMNRTISFTLAGSTEAELESAFQEALKHLQAGCSTGFDRDGSSSFFFETADGKAASVEEVGQSTLQAGPDSLAAFVDQVAGLSIWDYDKDDGQPYSETEEPEDGYMDSHNCLMGLIEQARDVSRGLIAVSRSQSDGVSHA